MAKKNSEYWAGRFESVQDRLMARGEAFYKKAYKECQKAANELEKEVETFYSRFAKENEMSLQEARRILNTEERKKFQMTLDEYIEKGRTLNYSNEWAKELENASTVYRISRIKALQIGMRQQAEAFAAYYNKGMEQLITDVYTDGYYSQIYEIQQGLGVGYAFDKIDPQYIETIIARPWAADGRTFSSRIWGTKKTVVDYMDKRIMRGLMTGEDKRVLIREMADKFKAQFNTPEAARSAAGRLVMTEAAYYSAVSTKKSYDSQGIKKFTYIATLDEKTCPVCGALDGKTFDVKDYAPGVNAEPLHSRCRCHTMPQEDDFFTDAWDEALKDEPEIRAARGKDGKTYKVDKMTYAEWSEKYVNS